MTGTSGVALVFSPKYESRMDVALTWRANRLATLVFTRPRMLFEPWSNAAILVATMATRGGRRSLYDFAVESRGVFTSVLTEPLYEVAARAKWGARVQEAEERVEIAFVRMACKFPPALDLDEVFAVHRAKIWRPDEIEAVCWASLWLRCDDAAVGAFQTEYLRVRNERSYPASAAISDVLFDDIAVRRRDHCRSQYRAVDPLIEKEGRAWLLALGGPTGN